MATANRGTISKSNWNALVARIDDLSHPAGKDAFVKGVVDFRDDQRFLRAFARQYHYFSVMQASLIPALIQCFEPTDVRALAELSEILADEYGNGKAQDVHSEVFKQFAKSVGVNAAELPIKASEVVPGIRNYLDGIRRAYESRKLPRVLAAYAFLERSAVHSYAPLLSALRTVKVKKSDLEFFRLHVELEPQHANVAVEFVKARLKTNAEINSFETEIQAFGVRWARFWADLYDVACATRH